MFFRLVMSVGQRKNSESPMSPRLRSDALPLSHKDSLVSRVYYEVLMTRVLHTVRISNVDGIMFVRKVEMVSFELGEELRKMFFRLVTSVVKRKNSESP